MKKLLKQKDGFTVIEAVVAQIILTIGALSVWSLFVVGMQLNAESEDRTIATNIAQQKMEEIMNTRFKSIVTTYPAGQVLFMDEAQEEPFWIYNGKGELVTSLPDGKYTISYPDGLDADPLRIQVKVSWEGLKPNSFVSMETLVSITPGKFR